MLETMEPAHQCNLCKRTFKQKSSLVRHAKRCTLEPVPSVRQKACNNCISAKSRCDLKRPVCARCNLRSLSCTYMRPVRALVNQETPSSTLGCTDNPDSVPASSGLAGGQNLGGRQIDLDTETVPIENLNPDLSTYLEHDIGLPGLVPAAPRLRLHDCSLSHIFPDCAGEVAGATSSPKHDFQDFYTTSSGTSSPHGVISTDSHCSSSSSTGTADVSRIVEDSSNSPGTGTDLPLVSRANIQTMRLLSEEGGCVSLVSSKAKTTDEMQIDPWILDLAAKPIDANPPELVQHSSETLFRAFRSWPRMLAKGIQLPPTIHFLQFCDGTTDPRSLGTPKHLARCITLCKLWVGQADDSGQIVQGAVKGEVDCILSKYHTFDAPTLLAAAQSINILLILLMFPSNRQASLSSVPASILTSIQQMGYHMLSTGMVLHEEATHACPPWRIWAHIEAKRRTILSIYFLIWAYSVAYESRHFNCLQLGRMLAPGPKYLWQATDEKTWRNLYARWLAQWNGRVLVQAEFFLVDKGPVMDPRVETWLEDADELGILIMSILNATQRDLSQIANAEDHIIG